MAVGGRGRAGGTAALAVLALLAAAVPARAEADAGAPAPSSTAAPVPAPDDAAAKGETQAAAAQRQLSDLETEVIELRRALDALERQRVAFDDIRSRLDQLDTRLTEDERRDAAVAGFGARDDGPGSIRFREDGFVIRSRDGRFLLRPRVRIQTVYTGELADAGAADPADPDHSSFALAHAEVILEGHAVDKRFEYRLQLDAARPLGGGALGPPVPQAVLDAFVQWRATRSLGVRVGQFKVPYGLQDRYWTADLSFVDVSAPTAAFRPGWDLGLMVLGRPLAGRLQYELAAVNGGGPLVANDNIDMAYAARIVAAPFGPLPESEGDVEGHDRPLVSAGVSGLYDLVPTDVLTRDPTANIDIDGNGRRDNVAVWQGGVELRAIWRGASLQAEWFSRLEDPGIAATSRRFWGAYAQASYFVIPRRLLVGARIGQTDLPLYGVTAAERARRGTQTTEQSAVVGAYLGGNRAKLQVDYSHLDSEAALSAPTVHRVRAAVQLGF